MLTYVDKNATTFRQERRQLPKGIVRHSTGIGVVKARTVLPYPRADIRPILKRTNVLRHALENSKHVSHIRNITVLNRSNTALKAAFVNINSYDLCTLSKIIALFSHTNLACAKACSQTHNQIGYPVCNDIRSPHPVTNTNMAEIERMRGGEHRPRRKARDHRNRMSLNKVNELIINRGN